MAKTQPKIDDIKDLKKATITSDGLMSADDKIKLDSAIQGVMVNSVEITPDTGVVDITIPTTVEELSDSSEYAHLSNGKILEGNLPDYIFGQVLFGGFIAINTSTNKLVCTLSAKLKSKYNILVDTLLLEDMPAANYEGVYFMATNSWDTQPNDSQVGDWLISNGTTWSKVDNSDAVSSVNGQTGVVNLGYEDLGDMPVATDTKVGGIKLGFNPDLDADLLDGKHASDFATSTHNHDSTYLGINDVATATKVGGIKIGFPGINRSIPVKLDINNKAYIDLLASVIRYVMENDPVIPASRYWLRNKTIIVPDDSFDTAGFSEGLRIANNQHKYSLIALGTESTSSGLNSDGNQWNIIKHPTGELTISFDKGFVNPPTNSNRTGLTLYKNGDIYWQNTKLNLPRGSSSTSGWLHNDDFRRFERVADHAQITLVSGNLQVDKETLSISGKEIFEFDNPDFDDFELYDADSGSYNLARGRRYEVIINIGMHVSTTGVVAIQLHETGGANIKRTSTTTNVGYVSMSLSCIVNGDILITFSILKDAATVLNLMQNECWFAVHEIK